MKPFSAVDSAQIQILPRESGFVAGSKIFTLDGELPVEHLCSGDRVITRDTGMAVLMAIQAIQIECNMVSIAKGALGQNSPATEIVLPAKQHVLLRNWRAVALTGKKQALVPAGSLVNIEHIRPLGPKPARLFNLIFGQPHIVYVDGVEMQCGSPQRTMSVAA